MASGTLATDCEVETLRPERRKRWGCPACLVADAAIDTACAAANAEAGPRGSHPPMWLHAGM
jgi:hypothetical protein